MGLSRVKGCTVNFRLRSSFWTSAGAVVALFAFALVSKSGVRLDDLLSENTRSFISDSKPESEPADRRLEDSLYPDDLFLTKPYDEDPGRHGKMFIHIILIGYMLLGLNTVCDIYFTGAIEALVDAYSIKADVAGATFMAAGGSAPELFTSLIGATLVMNDVGFGTIVGSAVFNVLFVIGLCGYVSVQAIDLSWWPLFRDCTYYIISLAVLAICAADKEIELYEAVILFSMYIIYCLIMWKNEQLQGYAEAQVAKRNNAKVAPAAYVVSGDDVAKKTVEANTETYGKLQESDGDKKEPAPEITGQEQEPEPAKPEHKEADGVFDSDFGPISQEPEPAKPEPATDKATGEICSEELKEEDEEEDDFYMDMPEGTFNRIIWVVSMPVYGPLFLSYAYLHFPKEKSDARMAGCFWLVFAQSLIWIAAFSYCLVWWVTVVFVDVLGFSVTVMGFTLLAAGTSIPDAVSSVAVARKGEGDMAVSSSIGSNIFDILVGLPLPWMIKIGLIEGAIKGNAGHIVGIASSYITFYVVLLLIMVACVVASIHMMGWKLNRALGVCMAILYAIFLSLVLFVEVIYAKL